MKNTILEHIKNCKISLFRFEGLQDYSAEDGDDNVKAFIETEKLPITPIGNEWWKAMKEELLHNGLD